MYDPLVSLRNTTEEYSVHRHVKKSREKSTARKFLYNKNLTPCVFVHSSSTMGAVVQMTVSEAVKPAVAKPVT